MRLMIAAGSLLLALGGAAAAAPIYKWVDAEGVTHFGAHPPAGQPAETFSISNIGSRPSPPAPAVAIENENENENEEQAALDRQVQREVAQQQAELKTYCTSLRTSLAQLTNNPRLRVEEDGQSRRIDEEERQARIAETRQKIAEDC
ncbi:DUF4124 domain-containing protein [Stutzerimonas tarimensis]|uniref:DUF4124 domain-containing protein n=1 Tax=Stutzerimonas tarimensis TaxID=1507735 RepID=A0ABV7T254_9GAMM